MSTWTWIDCSGAYFAARGEWSISTWKTELGKYEPDDRAPDKKTKTVHNEQQLVNNEQLVHNEQLVLAVEVNEPLAGQDAEQLVHMAAEQQASSPFVHTLGSIQQPPWEHADVQPRSREELVSLQAVSQYPIELVPASSLLPVSSPQGSPPLSSKENDSDSV